MTGARLTRPLARSGVTLRVTLGVTRHVAPTAEEVPQKLMGGCHIPPFHFSRWLFGFFLLSRLPRTAPVEREKTGATPLFSPLVRLVGGEMPHRVSHPVPHLPRRYVVVAPVRNYPLREG